MNKDEIKKVLRIILKKIDNRKFIWRLDGSVNLIIQGLDTSARDLDISTNKEGIEIFRDLLKEHISEDFYSEKIKGQSLICYINGFEVEINCFGDRNLDFFEEIKEISWENLNVPILPLEYMKKFYSIIGRTSKIELIENFLKN